VTFRTVFFGTPEFAVPTLAALHELTHVVGVVCQPDRHAGRGMRLQPPPVKRAALERGLDVYQPERVRNGELEARLRALEADAAVVAAYGRILPAGVLRAPRLGCLNLHASILPYYRGAAPIQWCLLDGRSETGISLMQMDEGMDTGPVYSVRKLPIPPEMNAGELTLALAELAADVVRHELQAALRGELQALPQEHAAATSAPPITREQARIDWQRSSRQLADQVRAFAPTPGAFTSLGERRLKVLQARAGQGGGATAAPGTLLLGPAGVEVACGAGTLVLERAQLEGRTAQSARDLLNGRVLEVGQRLGGAESPA
jgi:methionyl-tRNA formyltransferase